MEFAFKLEFLADQIIEHGILKRVSTASSEGVDMFCRNQNYSVVLALADAQPVRARSRGADHRHQDQHGDDEPDGASWWHLPTLTPC